MNPPAKLPAKPAQKPNIPALASRAEELRAALRLVPPTLLAERTALEYLATGPGRGEFRFSFFSASVLLPYPQLVAYDILDAPFNPSIQALLLYHLFTSNGAPLTAKWVSFADLPDGRMYNQAFQGYSGDLVRDAVANNLEIFTSACLALGGQPVELGSAAFAFSALPRLPLLITFWPGDEDFLASCKVLFDASAREHLPIDVCAILGSQLTGKIVRHIQSVKSA